MTSNATDAFRVCLFYESSSGNVSVLLGEQVDRGFSYTSEQDQLLWTWQDTTGSLASASPEAVLGPPSGIVQTWVEGPRPHPNYTFEPFQLYVLDQSNGMRFTVFQYFPDNGSFIGGGTDFNGPIPVWEEGGNPPTLQIPANETASVQASDLFINDNPVFFGLWVDETKPIMISFGDSPAESPRSPFPFPRFAALKSTELFLYHHINSSCFVEDVWGNEAHNWVRSTNISISTWD